MAPTASTISGIQWPATNGGSDQSRQNTPIVGRRSGDLLHARDPRSRRPAASSRPALLAVEHGRRRSRVWAITSSSVCGSSETTSRRRRRPSSIQRLLHLTRSAPRRPGRDPGSGSRRAVRGGAGRCPGRRAAGPRPSRWRTAASISREVSGRPWGSALRETTGFVTASGGKSHSSVTPTRSSPSPSAYTISVAEGSSETIFIAASLPGARRPPAGRPGR